MFALYGDCFILLKATIYITFNQTGSSQRIFESENSFSAWGGEQLAPLPSPRAAGTHHVDVQTICQGLFFFLLHVKAQNRYVSH